MSDSPGSLRPQRTPQARRGARHGTVFVVPGLAGAGLAGAGLAGAGLAGAVRAVSGLAVAALAVAGLSGCQLSTAPQGGTAPHTATTNTVGSLPGLVGRGLQNAQDTAQAAGYSKLTSHDALGRGRHQILDRDWKVCFQKPGPGRVPTASTIDFGAVKLDENCPATDQADTAPPVAGATMPDLIGKSVTVAEQALGSDASVSIKDATGADRFVVVGSNWKVCTQQPAPGQPYNGVPVTLTVAKFTESC